MGRITQMNVIVAILTIVMVYVGRETNMYWCMDVGEKS